LLTSIKISVCTFVTYVNALVVQTGLLSKLPFAIFTPGTVSEHDAGVIAQIAGEKEGDSKERLDCEEKIRNLKEALRVFEEYTKL
jgi:hypothetical protein